jgi:hypothetical protein
VDITELPDIDGDGPSLRFDHTSRDCVLQASFALLIWIHDLSFVGHFTNDGCFAQLETVAA